MVVKFKKKWKNEQIVEVEDKSDDSINAKSQAFFVVHELILKNAVKENRVQER